MGDYCKPPCRTDHVPVAASNTSMTSDMPPSQLRRAAGLAAAYARAVDTIRGVVPAQVEVESANFQSGLSCFSFKH